MRTNHSSKRQLLGNQAGRVPPAWRDQRQTELGSKILLSRLPPDVGELEVEERPSLFLAPSLTQTRVFANRNSSERRSALSRRPFSYATPRVTQRAWPSSHFSGPVMPPSPVQSTTASLSTDVSILLVASNSPISHPRTPNKNRNRSRLDTGGKPPCYTVPAISPRPPRRRRCSPLA